MFTVHRNCFKIVLSYHKFFLKGTVFIIDANVIYTTVNGSTRAHEESKGEMFVCMSACLHVCLFVCSFFFANVFNFAFVLAPSLTVFMISCACDDAELQAKKRALPKKKKKTFGNLFP